MKKLFFIKCYSFFCLCGKCEWHHFIVLYIMLFVLFVRQVSVSGIILYYLYYVFYIIYIMFFFILFILCFCSVCEASKCKWHHLRSICLWCISRYWQSVLASIHNILNVGISSNQMFTEKYSIEEYMILIFPHIDSQCCACLNTQYLQTNILLRNI